MENQDRVDTQENLQDLSERLGRPIKPQELARILGVDARTLRKHYRQWGGAEICPGVVRFFENRICEILGRCLYAEPNNETREEALRGDRMDRQSKRPDKAFPGRQQEKLSGGNRMGKQRKRALPPKDETGGNRHGVFEF